MSVFLDGSEIDFILLVEKFKTKIIGLAVLF